MARGGEKYLCRKFKLFELEKIHKHSPIDCDGYSNVGFIDRNQSTKTN